MMSKTGKKFPIEIWDDAEFERRDGSFEIWFQCKVEKITMEWRGSVSYVRKYKVIKVLNNNIHLN